MIWLNPGKPMKKSNNTKTVQENEPNKGKKPDQDKKSELNSDEWKDKYLRALADYRNLERRVSEKAAEVKKFANKDFILKLLPIIDDLETAAKLLPDKGLELILNKFINLLQEENVEKVDCLDEDVFSRPDHVLRFESILEELVSTEPRYVRIDSTALTPEQVTTMALQHIKPSLPLFQKQVAPYAKT